MCSGTTPTQHFFTSFIFVLNMCIYIHIYTAICRFLVLTMPSWPLINAVMLPISVLCAIVKFLNVHSGRHNSSG